MTDINQVVIVGRLTRDAELKYTSSGFAIGSFSIAVNRKRKDGDQWVDEVSFFDVNLFGRQAENINQYLVKGKQVAIQGELRQDRWEQNGQSRSKVIIVANNVQLMGGGGSGNAGQQSGGGYGQNRQMPNPYQQPHAPAQPQRFAEYDAGQSYGGDGDFPEEIPF